MWILDLITNNPKLLNFNLIGAGTKPQWTVLKHNGPMFPPEYIPHKIPVIINNEETDCTVFVNLLNKLGLPFYEIKSLDVFSNTTENELFNEKMYRKIIYRLNCSIQNLKQLKLEYYDNVNA